MPQLDHARIDLHLFFDKRDLELLFPSPQPPVGGADARTGAWNAGAWLVQIDCVRLNPLDHLARNATELFDTRASIVGRGQHDHLGWRRPIAQVDTRH